MRSLFLLTCALAFTFPHQTAGQTKEPDTVTDFPVKVPMQRTLYVGNGLDFAMVSTAILSKPGKTTHLTMPRFTAVVNLGVTFNYDLNRRVGFMSGIGLRNMGLIEKLGDTTIKRRVYALGVPLGIKIGDLRNRDFIFLGGGVDIPLHYKEKQFVKRSNKQKEGDWFSDKTAKVMPFVFLGYSFDPGITLKLQYYPANFFNIDYTEAAPGFFPGGAPMIKPFAGYKAHLLLLSLGIDIHYNQYKMQQREYLENKAEREKQNKLM